ncbi:polysaccharide biosynthesis/export family protein [Allopontixanthobacter sediminis]|uniref:Sugar transporter n=1 Tax=Allopontixanthobacter sediminis TaxID=1689985 RepID=A0A845B2I7_9SPHN|nr:polysaccharide biosynthesis/export family protein [Allopontixanthobacter sediminis]MXP44630.1 sugar transporter [Allopontixanthobacter sediminis]
MFSVAIMGAAPASARDSGPAALQISQAAASPVSVSGLPVYRINPGDELEINVWREDQLQRSVKVLPDGSISFPLVGSIQGAGRTPQEIERTIAAALAQKYVDGNVPDVTVAVTNPAGLQFSVIGKVRSAGIFTPGRYVTLLEAISFAGGTDEFASLDDIVIIRKSGGALTTIPASLSGILRSKSISSEAVRAIPIIESGDTVIVP